ncbi:hypothetical protein [Salibacterium sp. K-3]
MKAVMIGAIVLIIMTLIGSLLGASNPKPAHIIAPVVGSILSSAILLGLMTWENRKGT